MHRLLSEEFKDFTTLSESTGLIYHIVFALNHMPAKGTCHLQNLKKIKTKTDEKLNKRNNSIQDGGRNHQVHVENH